MSPSEPWSSLFDSTPINTHLGLRLVRAEAREAEVRLRPGAHLVQEAGVIHGGILTTLADTAAVYSLLPALPRERTLIGLELKLDFLRPARPDAGELVARARALRAGRSLGVVRVEVLQGEAQLALGLFTYLFRDRA